MDIHITHGGYMKCASGYSFGPVIHKGFLLHFVLSGCGVYCESDRKNKIRAGQAFLIWPGKTVSYYADKDTPWEYAWIGFRGEDALKIIAGLGLSENVLVCSLGRKGHFCKYYHDFIQDIRQCSDRETQRIVATSGLLHLLVQDSVHGEQITVVSPILSDCAQARRYIRNNLRQNISVEHVANSVGLSRSQLFREFKQIYGKSPREIIALMRNEEAQRLLTNSSLTLAEIAEACGYANKSHFCTAFRRICGISPTNFRKSIVDEMRCDMNFL